MVVLLEYACIVVIKQPALIIGTSISGWRVIWSGHARLSYVRVSAMRIEVNSLKSLKLSSANISFNTDDTPVLTWLCVYSCFSSLNGGL